MFYQTETVNNEFVLYCHHSDKTRIYERNHLFERWREISKVVEGHSVTACFTLSLPLLTYRAMSPLIVAVWRSHIPFPP